MNLKFWMGFILMFVFGCLLAGVAFSAESMDRDRAVRAIIGEAEGEGYDGMYAVACGLRNRGSFDGVYGDRAVILHKGRLWRFKDGQPQYEISTEIIQKAGKAWSNAEWGEDVTGGATHWENIDQFGVPYWARGLKKTAKIGSHTFYKT